MNDTSDSACRQPHPPDPVERSRANPRPIWQRLLLQACIGAAGTAGSVAVTWMVYLLQRR